MPHVREKGIDFVVSAFIVHEHKPVTLLVRHKKLKVWLAIGGHIGDHDPYEDSDQALAKEVLEETGLVLDKTVFVSQPPDSLARLRFFDTIDRSVNHNCKALALPWAVELHDYPPVPGHKHLALVYLLVATTLDVRLEADAHDEIRWFSEDDLSKVELLPSIDWYCRQAITTIHGTKADRFQRNFNIGFFSPPS